METFFIPTICLVPSLVYLSLAVYLASGFRRESGHADRAVLLIRRDYMVFLFLIALCFITGIPVYILDAGDDGYDALDQTILKLYLMSSAVPCMLMRRTLFNGRTWMQFYVCAAFSVSVLLVSDALTYAGYNAASRSVLCRGAIFVNILAFLLCARYGIMYAFSSEEENRQALGRELVAHGMAFVVYNILFLMYSFHLHPVLDYFIATVGFAIVHSTIAVAVHRHISLVAYVFCGTENRQHEVPVMVTDAGKEEDTGGQPGTVQVSLKERLLGYFESEKPYLSKNLSMEEVAMRLYTNKTYLSKTINVEMNKNFRELVNYFRVKEAIRIFHENNDISMSELREKCGFNNNASFTSAFKLNTGYTPGEWCRDMKNRKDKAGHENE